MAKTSLCPAVRDTPRFVQCGAFGYDGVRSSLSKVNFDLYNDTFRNACKSVGSSASVGFIC